ncbi:hypothetical protein D9M70_260140 [compost metagenome]
MPASLPMAPTQRPAKLSMRITTTFLIGRVPAAGGVKSRRMAALSGSTSLSLGVSSISRTLARASSSGRVAFQALSRWEEKLFLAASTRVSVPFRPSWLANIESVVKASPQRSGGPWRR